MLVRHPPLLLAFLLTLAAACHAPTVPGDVATDDQGTGDVWALRALTVADVARRQNGVLEAPRRDRTPTARGDAIEAPCATGETRWVRVPCSSWGTGGTDDYTTRDQYGREWCQRCTVNVCDQPAPGELMDNQIELSLCSSLPPRQAAREREGR